MKRGLVCLLLAGIFMTGCGDNSVNNINREIETSVSNMSAEEEQAEDAGSEIGDLEDCVVAGLICYQTNPEEYNKVSDCNISFGQIMENIESDNKVITIPVKMKMTGEYTVDCMDYSFAITPCIVIADKETGVIFPVENGNGTGEYANSGSIVDQGESIAIAYNCKYYSAEGGWSENADGSFYKDIEFDIEYSVKAPKDYQGLLLGVAPVESYEQYLDDEIPGSIHDIENIRIFNVQ